MSKLIHNSKLITQRMTQLYLLCYITYTTFTSIILSILLAVRLLVRRISAGCSNSDDGAQNNIVALYEGTVYHERRHPARNSFRFRARYALINLDLPPYSPPNYLSADSARLAAKTNGPVHLLRIPPSLGYERSPVNLYYCYHFEQGSNSPTLKKCLVEASNTPWGESVTFVFNPTSDVIAKSEYISPFMDMDGSWRLKVNEPGEHLYAFISVQHPKFPNYFNASLTAERVVSSSSSMHRDDVEAFFWLVPQRVSIAAYWNAVKLSWKNVPFYPHPRKENPAYREEAVLRDENIQLCPVFGAKKQGGQEKIDRCFTWKDSKWPWKTLIE